MVYAPVRRDNPELKHKPCSISLGPYYGVYGAKDSVSVDCSTIHC